MSLTPLQDDGFPSFTKTSHRTPYASISPTRPELSLKGKTVIITGAGSGIGRTTALAFAAAGASSIFLLGGRREELLVETAHQISIQNPSTKVDYAAISISNTAAIKSIIATKIESWDVLLLNAGYLPSPCPLLEADLNDWGSAWSTNFSGNLQILQLLLPKRRPDASVLGTNTCGISLATEWCVGLLPYVASKIAFAKALEVLTAEVKDCHFVSFHPGSGEFSEAVWDDGSRDALTRALQW